MHKLKEKKIDLIVLAGYMRIIGPVLLKNYDKRIINIHPSLLPAFPGLHGIRDAFEAGVKETGVTIHYIDQGVDTGPIIRAPCEPTNPVTPGVLRTTYHEASVMIISTSTYPGNVL